MENYSKNNKKRVRVFPVILLFFALIITLLFIDSNFRIVSTEYELYYSNLPEPFDGFRIVLLADIHDTEFGKDNKRLISSVNDANPDIIVIAGDLLNAYFTRRPVEEQLERVEPLINGLTAIAPVYFVTGNHENSEVIGSPDALLTMLEESGINVMRNEYMKLTSDDKTIILVGIDANRGAEGFRWPGTLVKEIYSADSDAFIIILEHRNNFLQFYSDLGVDLLLSGHAHGGLIRLPFTDGIIGPNRDFMPTYTSGVYTMGDTKLLVTRGLGTTAIWPRFLNNPHIAVAVLRSEEDIA